MNTQQGLSTVELVPGGGLARLKAPIEPPSVFERARRYLRRCPPAVSGQRGHDATFRAACVLVQGFALSEGEALAVLREWNATCQPPWSEGELRHKVVSAANAPHSKPRGYLAGGLAVRPTVGGRSAAFPHPPAPLHHKPKFQPATLKRVAAQVPGVDEQYVKDRSPLCPETQTPASFLQRLYQPGETVIVFDRERSQGAVACTFGEGPYDARCLDYLIHGCKDGVWFLCTPVDGEYHPNPREGNKLSRRSQESVTAWRYLVLESDDADARDWLAMLVQLPLRISAIYTSGGKSIHALVRVDAASKADWDAMAYRLKPLGAVLGADDKTITAVRLTRLPGCYRGQEGPPRPDKPWEFKRWVDEPLEVDEGGDPIWTPKQEPEPAPASLWRGGKLQELLYLDADPDGKPIRLRPTRQEIHEAWLARMRAGKEGKNTWE